VRLTGLYNRSDFDGLGIVPFTVATGEPTLGYSTTNFLPVGDTRTQKLGYGEISYDFGFAALTSLTSYSDASGRADYDVSANAFFKNNNLLAPGASTFHTKKFTEEVRLASPASGRFQWLIGGFYTNEDSVYTESIRALLASNQTPSPTYDPAVSSLTPSKFRESAVFANATFEITDKWDVSGGVRYSANEQEFTAFRSGKLQGANVFTPPTSDNSTTFSVNTRYHFSPDVMVYARVATGYRPGGSNTIIMAGVPLTYAPDDVINYEVGLKSQFLDKRGLINISAFYIDWNNIQISDRIPVNGVLFSFVGNAGKARSQGVEFETRFNLTRDLRIGAVGTYTDATIRNNAPVVGAVAGDRLPYAPKFAGSASLDWSHQSADGLKPEAHLVWRYVGDRRTNFPLAAAGSTVLGDYDTVDISAGVSRDNWRVNLFIKNVGNTRALLSAFNLGAAILPPRTAGLSLEFGF
jgi:outer membrane receptor protein involved in Fe transport